MNVNRKSLYYTVFYLLAPFLGWILVSTSNIFLFESFSLAVGWSKSCEGLTMGDICFKDDFFLSLKGFWS